MPVAQRHLTLEDGSKFEAILARPEFLPETWQNRVLSQNTEAEQDVAPLQTYSTSDCFLEHPRLKEEDCKLVCYVKLIFIFDFRLLALLVRELILILILIGIGEETRFSYDGFGWGHACF